MFGGARLNAFLTSDLALGGRLHCMFLYLGISMMIMTHGRNVMYQAVRYTYQSILMNQDDHIIQLPLSSSDIVQPLRARSTDQCPDIHTTTHKPLLPRHALQLQPRQPPLFLSPPLPPPQKLHPPQIAPPALLRLLQLLPHPPPLHLLLPIQLALLNRIQLPPLLLLPLPFPRQDRPSGEVRGTFAADAGG